MFTRLNTLLVCLVALLPGLLLAQVATLDLDPPNMDHYPVAATAGASSEVISVTVRDLQGIKAVLLHYRFATDDPFSSVKMQPAGAVDVYEAELRLAQSATELEYYFEAIDIGGNRVLNGMPFEPYSRQVEFSNQAPEPIVTTNAASTVQGSDEPPARVTSNRTLWVVLGLVALGVLASSASDSSGASTPAGTSAPVDPAAPNIPVTLSVPVP